MALKTAQRRLFRSRDAYIGGVCAGIADYYDLDALVVRILCVPLFIMSFGLVSIVYLVMWAHVPLAPEEVGPVEIEPESAILVEHGSMDYLMVKNDQGEEELIRLPIRGLSVWGRVGLGGVLVFLFLALAIALTSSMPGVQWWQFWPLLPMILGLFFMVVPVRSRFAAVWKGVGIVMAVAAASVLPMSMGVVAWDSLNYALELFWPILAVAVVLFISGMVRDLSALVMGGAFCFVLFCLVGCIMCVLPGEIEAIMLPFIPSNAPLV